MPSIRKLNQPEIDSYSHLPSDLAAKVRVIEARIPLPHFVGITLGRFVFVKPGCDKMGQSDLISHELVHVRQWHELGIVGFVSKYVGDFTSNLLKQRSWMKAYRNIELEAEARQICELWLCRPNNND